MNAVLQILPIIVALASGVVIAGVALFGPSRVSASIGTLGPDIPGDGVALPAGAERVSAGVSLRMWIALAVTALVLVLGLVDPLGLQPESWIGVGRALSPGIAAAAGCLVIIVSPMPGWPGARTEVRVAELAPRSAKAFGPRWAFVLPVATAGLFVLLLVAMGLSTMSGSDSRSITIANDHGSSTAGPYPGWYYGVPLIGVTVALAVIVLLALRRVAGAAAPAQASTARRGVDLSLRRILTRFVMLLSSASLLFSFGATTIAAGSSTVNAAQWITTSTGTADSSFVVSVSPPLQYLQPAFAIGVVEMVLGGILVGASLVAAAFAVGTSIPRGDWGVVGRSALAKSSL